MAPGGVPPWVLEALGPAATDIARIPWGFTNESWVGTAGDGATLVATRYSSPDRAARLARLASRVAPRLAAVGIDTPVPDERRSVPGRAFLVSPWIKGVPGMVGLADPDGPRAVGAAAGEAWRRLQAVDARGIDADDRWARPAALVEAAKGWLAMAERDMAPSVGMRLADQIADLASLLDGRPARFVHGDLVPANLLLRDGQPPAVLDLETVRLGDALFDPAWFRWIVRYHHPDASGAAFTAFGKAAGLELADEGSRLLLAALPTVRILEILADASLEASVRRRWLAHLAAIAEDDVREDLT